MKILLAVFLVMSLNFVVFLLAKDYFFAGIAFVICIFAGVSLLAWYQASKNA